MENQTYVMSLIVIIIHSISYISFKLYTCSIASYMYF